jgi:hypothetical protein
VNANGVSGGWVNYVDEFDQFIAVTAANLTTEAGGGNTTYYQDGEPTGGEYAEGDLWFDTNDNNKIYRYGYNTDEPPTLDWIAASGNLVGTTVSTGLSDISANMGVLTAGKIQNADQTFIIDLALKKIYIA